MQSPTPESISILSIPDELLLSCIARLSRLYYPTLSLVSKRFRSLIVSPELYKARSLLNRSETCLYVCMQLHSDPNPTWFNLCLRPDQTLSDDDVTDKEENEYVLAKVPIPNSPSLNVSGLVSVGSCIYNINGLNGDVSVLDCRTHTWRDIPSLPVQLLSMTASVLDDKIYVAGCYKDDDSMEKNCLEVLETKTGVWDHEPVPCLEAKNIFYNSKSASINGKIHVKTGLQVVAYDPMEGKWELAGNGMRQYKLLLGTYCVIRNVLYSVYKGRIRWYDTKNNKWIILSRMGVLPKFRDKSRVRLADYGGKMVVLWDEFSTDGSEKVIWCAVLTIARPRCNPNYVLGVINWVDRVLTLPLGYDFVNVFSATV